MVLELAYVALVAFSSVVAVAVAVWLYDDGMDLSARLFVALVALYAVVGTLVVGELLAPAEELAVGFYHFHAAVGAAIPLGWFLFTAVYTGHRRRLPRTLFVLLFGYYVLVAGLELTNLSHGLIWSDFSLAAEPFPYVLATPTPLSGLLLTPLTLLYYAGMGLLGSHLLFGSGAKRKQTLALFLGYVPPLFVLTAWFAGFVPGPLNGALVVASTPSLALVAWAVSRHQLFDLVPMARETVLESLDEIVVVVDDSQRVLDYNRAAVATFPDIEGSEGADLASVLPELVAAGTDGRESDSPGTTPDGDVTAAELSVGDAATPTDEGAGVVDVFDGDDSTVDASFVESFTRYGDDGLREYSVTGTPLRVGDAVEGYALVVRDVTERRQHVRDLEQQTAQLERFASTLSHDLRNPLNVAHGRVELVREEGDEHLAKASDALERIDRIVEDTLTLAREGQAIDERERVALAAVARDAWTTTDAPGATLRVEFGDDARVYADRTRLQSVFENCFRNAVDHGGDDVTITVERTPDGFAVADDGPGVPPEDRETVFEYEYTTTEEGTGLGLAIVAAIIRAHGWEVSMTESDAGGARVVVSGVDHVDGCDALTDGEPAESDESDADADDLRTDGRGAAADRDTVRIETDADD